MSSRPFFFGAGFECASHLRADGVRLDLTVSSHHDRLAAADYGQVRDLGLRHVRDGMRWHLIERVDGSFDWTSVLPLLHASIEQHVSVTWDLLHFGWPDHLDIWSCQFVDHFARFSKAAARLVRDACDAVPTYCPINEMSYLAWAGGQAAWMNPFAVGRADELKQQLVRACIASMNAIREVDKRARFLTAEPLIHVEPRTGELAEVLAAQRFRMSQFEAMDMLSGKLLSELGGCEANLDVIGINFYPQNQWFHAGSTIPMGHQNYRPLHQLLREVFDRYQRPLRISETGAEGSSRPYWLNHVCGEVALAVGKGVPIEGLYWYPILDYPGWDDERICTAGLLSLPDGNERTPYAPLLNEIIRQRSVLQSRVSPLRLTA